MFDRPPFVMTSAATTVAVLILLAAVSPVNPFWTVAVTREVAAGNLETASSALELSDCEYPVLADWRLLAKDPDAVGYFLGVFSSSQIAGGPVSCPDGISSRQ